MGRNRSKSWNSVLVTGGAGFIGSSFLNQFVPLHPELQFINADLLTYAGNLKSLEPIAQFSNCTFCRVDVADAAQVDTLFQAYKPDAVFHFAAESHVDRSILTPNRFVETNVLGTLNLLQACRQIWSPKANHVFHHVSTDEVFGSLGNQGAFTEATPYDPSSPYSASKAASDHLVRAWSRTYDLQVTLTNCSNNYGPRQFPEKLIPLMILNAIERKPLPIYGNGLNVRDWLYVEDHCEAVWMVADEGSLGETYAVGGRSERTNLEVVESVAALVAQALGIQEGQPQSQIEWVADRPGHDFRYAIDTSKIQSSLGWNPVHGFESGLRKTVEWYLSHQSWVDSVRSGEYRKWIDQNYARR